MMIRNYPEDFWRTGIAFYLDGVGFFYKRSPKGRVWRKASEGPLQGCAAKENACGTGCNYVKFVVAISYEKGVICAEPYDKKDGDYFAGFLRKNFEQPMKDSGKNSRQAKQAMLEVNSDLFPVPPRSPELNPIENVFKNVKIQL